MIVSPDVVINIALNEEGYLEKSKLELKKSRKVDYEKSCCRRSDIFQKLPKNMSYWIGIQG